VKPRPIWHIKRVTVKTGNSIKDYVPGSNGEPEHFTPSHEEQAFLLLQGKCPHNTGWTYDGHGHNSSAWECDKCREIKWW
jgi:hypothetical protein